MIMEVFRPERREPTPADRACQVDDGRPADRDGDPSYSMSSPAPSAPCGVNGAPTSRASSASASGASIALAAPRITSRSPISSVSPSSAQSCERAAFRRPRPRAASSRGRMFNVKHWRRSMSDSGKVIGKPATRRSARVAPRIINTSSEDRLDSLGAPTSPPSAGTPPWTPSIKIPYGRPDHQTSNLRFVSTRAVPRRPPAQRQRSAISADHPCRARPAGTLAALRRTAL